MANRFWLVGCSGSRKTTVAVCLAGYYARPGIVCALVAGGIVSPYDVAQGDFTDEHDPGLLERAHFVFIEVHPSLFKEADLQPDDMVMHMRQVPNPPAVPAAAGE